MCALSCKRTHAHWMGTATYIQPPRLAVSMSSVSDGKEAVVHQLSNPCIVLRQKVPSHSRYRAGNVVIADSHTYAPTPPQQLPIHHTHYIANEHHGHEHGNHDTRSTTATTTGTTTTCTTATTALTTTISIATTPTTTTTATTTPSSVFRSRRPVCVYSHDGVASENFAHRFGLVLCLDRVHRVPFDLRQTNA